MAEDIKLADLTAKVKVNTAGLAAASAEARKLTDQIGKDSAAANTRLARSSEEAAGSISKAFGQAQAEGRKLEDSQLKVASASVAAKKSAAELASAQRALSEVTKNTTSTEEERAGALLRVEDAQVKHARSTIALTRAEEDLASASTKAERSVRGLGNESDRAESKVRKLTEASQLGRVGFSGMTTAVLGLAPALLPIAGLATAGVLGLGAAFGAAGAAAGVLGVVTVLAFKDIKQAATAVKTAEKAVANANTVQQRATATLNLAQANAALRGSLGQAATAYLRLGTAWEGFKKANAPQTYALIGRGLDLIATVVPKLQPLFSVAAQAAGRFFEPFERAAQNGTIDATIARLAREAGPALASLQTIALNLAKTLGHLFTDFAPQGQGFLDWLAKATGRWEQWSATVSQSDGFQSFISFLKTNGPIVMATLSSLGGALVNILASMGPLSGVTLKVVGALANIVSAIPPGVLTPIIGALVAISVALKGIAAFQGVGKQLSSIFGGFTGKLREMNAESAKTAGGAGRIGNAFGLLAGSISPVGIALTVGAAALAIWAQDKAKARAETESFTRALEQDSGALGKNTRQTAVDNLEKAGALKAAEKLGISTSDLTDAVLGNAGAQERVGIALKRAGLSMTDLNDPIITVTSAYNQQRKEIDAAGTAYDRTSTALQSNAEKAANAAIRARELSDAAKQEAANQAALTNIIDIGAIKTETWAEKAAEAKTVLDGLNVTAGNLKQTLDLLNGVNIDATQAAISYTEAQVTLNQSIKDGGRSFALTTAAGRTNLTNLLNLATASGNYAQARARQAGSEEAGRQVMIRARSAFLAQAAALGVSKVRALELANAYFRIPRKVVTAVVLTYSGKTPDTVQREIQRIHGKNVVISVTTFTSTGKVTKLSAGGTVTGGIPGRDSVPALLMPGEEVLKKPDAAAYRRNRYRMSAGLSNALARQPASDGQVTNIMVAAGAIQINATSTGKDGAPNVAAIEQAAERALRRVLAVKRAGRRY